MEDATDTGRVLALHEALIARAVAIASDYPFLSERLFVENPDQETARLRVVDGTATLAWPVAPYGSFTLDELRFPAELLALDDTGLELWRASKRAEEQAAEAAAAALAQAEVEEAERAEFERLKAKFA